ncbi:cyclin-T1-like isoform X2 [Myxocyprinus asiaticus]|uniref:cyclin-T1-like isoform X2 n=1 Tax=Myxocyprinus asiaticus TaxID=70543 RepID=UPI002223C1AA|nr:cyclin-T1-like isoform X2 [Myxocyprinus asiaticus]
MAASFPAPSVNHNKWYFTREQIENSPSRRAGLDPDKELSYRQQAANLLQDMGQRLNVSQLTINTAIVYMHRFYMIQSFTRFHRNVIAPAALFLAAKVEEQPRKLEHVIKVTHACLNPQDPSPDTRSDTYLQQAQDLVILESIILQTLAFEITIDHPHTHVVKCTQLVRASKDLAQTSYFMATNRYPDDLQQEMLYPKMRSTSLDLPFAFLHLTTFCLQYSPPIVACVCIHLACKWSNWEIPVSTDSKHWWEYVDSTVTLELLDELTHEFLQILEKTPSRLKRIRNWKAAGQTGKKSKVQEYDQSDAIMSMISMAASDSTLAGLMSLSDAPCGSLISSSADDRNATASSQHWQPAVKEQQTTNELQAPAKVVSLNEYRAKHADELAAQKRKLENMEASVKQGYATATQALMNQQKKEKHQQQSSSGSSDLGKPSPIVLKIPLDEQSVRNPLKMRFPVPGSQSASGSSRGSEQDIKVRIRVPERRSGSGEDGKSREKHRERSNHHHHHHHNHHHHSSTSSSSSSSSSSSTHKHSSSASASGSNKKVSGDSVRMSSSSSRKRTHMLEPSAGTHPSKVSKSSRNSFQLPPLSTHSLGLPSDILPSLSLSHHQGNYSHSKTDKADTNGHNMGSQSNEFQDTFDMLNSLLSAQGVQPAQPQMFDYRTQYGEYRYSSSTRSGTQPPPLPSEPPPPLPPLPK